MADDWRSDDAWTLVEWSPEHFPEPPTKPTATAELAQPPVWASAYDEKGRIVATWHRPPQVSR